MTRLALALALATCAFLAPVGVFAFSANKPALRKRFHKIGHPAHALTMVMMTMVTIMVSAPALADWSPKWTCYDGDSCRLSWRLANVDTPEVRGQCEQERALAIQARDFTRAWLGKWRGVTVETEGLDKYGRVLVRVSRGGVDLGDALVSKGLGRPYSGGKREGWC